MKLRALPALLISASLSSVAADATAVTVNAGETVVFNFDLTGVLSPHTSFEHVFFYTGSAWSWTSYNNNEIAGTWKIYSGLNATGDLLGTNNFNLGNRGSDFPGWLDGVFSTEISMVSGSINTNPYAKGGFYDGTNWTYTTLVYPTVAASVPEPANAALMGLGALLVAGLSHSRRKARA